MYIREMLAENMHEQLGIVRDEATLSRGIEDMDYYLNIAENIRYDSTVLAYFNYSLPAILALAKAVLVSARERRESRGAHFRKDHPEEREDFRAASVISWDGGSYRVRYDREGRYER